MINVPNSWWHRGYMQALIDFEDQLKEGMGIKKQIIKNFSAGLRLHYFKTERARKHAVLKCDQGYEVGWNQAYRIYTLGVEKI